MDGHTANSLDSCALTRLDPPVVKMRIEGHRHYYHFTKLVPHYGEASCKAMAAAWGKAFALMPESTSTNYFKKFKGMLTWLAARAVQETDTPQTRLYHSLRQLPKISVETSDLEGSLHSFASDLFNLTNFSIIKSTNRKSRNKYMEGVKSSILYLSNVQLFPNVAIHARLTEYECGSSTPCLATLARQHGKFPQQDQSLEAAARAYNNENVRLCAELRKCLVVELQEEEKIFLRGQQMLADESQPSVKQIDAALCLNAKSNGKDRWAKDILGRDDPNRLLIAATKYLAAICHHGFEGEASTASISALIVAAGGRRAVSRYIEGTSRALNAAFHIVLIDTGWPPQPCEDFSEEPFVGGASRGKRKVRSVASRKHRSGGEPNFGALEAVETSISTKELDGTLPGAKVIELWQQMSAPLRNRARQLGDLETATRLWVWRSPMRMSPNANLDQIGMEWWPNFLQRHAENPAFGGLPITRRVIRKTVANIRAAKNDFDYSICKALANHRSSSMPFYYLSDMAVRRLLEDKIRQFVNLWEAVGVANIKDAALKLGVPEPELQRRKFLGLDAGLEFALVRSAERERPSASTAQTDESRFAPLVPTARTLVPTDTAMQQLHLARMAFKAKAPEVLALNPARWVRIWLPWMAIVEVYANKLTNSRHRARFSQAMKDIEKKLQLGTASLPLIW